jgi:acyl-CoA reductase-like NAD-dependent aldehyde dehydrogenase
MEVLNPATGEAIAEVPRGTKEDADRAVEAAKKALPEWLETTPGERAEALLKLADLLDEHAGGARRARVAERRQAAAGRARRDAVSSDNIRFFAGAGTAARGQGQRRVHARLHLDASSRAAGRRRRDHARGTTR